MSLNHTAVITVNSDEFERVKAVNLLVVNGTDWVRRSVAKYTPDLNAHEVISVSPPGVGALGLLKEISSLELIRELKRRELLGDEKPSVKKSAKLLISTFQEYLLKREDRLDEPFIRFRTGKVISRREMAYRLSNAEGAAMDSMCSMLELAAHMLNRDKSCPTEPETR
jgi:hypothetical protein